MLKNDFVHPSGSFIGTSGGRAVFFPFFDIVHSKKILRRVINVGVVVARVTDGMARRKIDKKVINSKNLKSGVGYVH